MRDFGAEFYRRSATDAEEGRTHILLAICDSTSEEEDDILAKFDCNVSNIYYMGIVNLLHFVRSTA